MDGVIVYMPDVVAATPKGATSITCRPFDTLNCLAHVCMPAFAAATLEFNLDDMQANAVDIDSATRLAWKYMMDSGDLLKGLEARQAFLDFMELLSASHPLTR